MNSLILHFMVLSILTLDGVRAEDAVTIKARGVDFPDAEYPEFLVDLNGDDRAELVTLGLGWNHADKEVLVTDLDTGQFVAVQAIAPLLKDIAPIKRSGRWPSQFVTVDQSGGVLIWEGIPLRIADSFRIDAPGDGLQASFVEVGNVDNDSSLELVRCARFQRLRIYDISSRVEQPFPYVECDDLRLAQFLPDAQLELLVDQRDSVPPRAYRADGSVIDTFPMPIGLIVELDGDPQAEMLVSNNNGTGSVDLGASWAIAPITSGNGSISVMDLDHDGRDEWLILAQSSFASILSISTGQFWTSTCPGISNDFDGNGTAESWCVDRVEEVPSGSIRWQRPEPTHFSAGPAFFANVLGDARHEIITVDPGRNTGVPARITTRDAETLDVLNRTTFEPTHPVDPGDLATVIAIDADPGAPLDVIVSGRSRTNGNSFVAKLGAGATVPTWYQFGNDAVELAPLSTGTENADDFASAGVEPNCAIARRDGASGAIQWSRDQELVAFDGYTTLRVLQVDGVGIEDVVYSCGGKVQAYRGEDGSPIWPSVIRDASARDIVRVVTTNGAELLFVNRNSLTRRRPSDGSVLGYLVGGGTAVDASRGYGDALIRSDGTVSRRNLETGQILTNELVVGSNRGGEPLVRRTAGAASGRAEYYVDTGMGPVLISAPVESPILLDGFE